MERKLYEASLGGNVTSLIELLEEDQLVLDNLIIRDFYGTTPLHIAAMRGHIDFASKLLRLKPELATELDSQGFYPLHLASAKENVDMVKLLLGANLNACNETDKEGRTPLHVAAVKGRVENMKVLIKSHPQAINKRLPYQNETILHLCVKYNRLEALKLLEYYLLMGSCVATDTREEESVVSVNSKDKDGNTILHLAVARRQIKVVKYLLDSNIGVELNATNNKGFTAMDILTQSTETRGHKDFEIGDLLRDAGVVVSLGAASRQRQPGDHDQSEQQSWRVGESTVGRRNEELDGEEWLKQKQEVLIVVASLIASMAFQGGVNPPGGVWQGNSDDPTTFPADDSIINNASPSPSSTRNSGRAFRYAGTSIMAYYATNIYYIYMSFNTIGFLFSLSVIYIFISGLIRKRRYNPEPFLGALGLSVTFMALAYLSAMTYLLPKSKNQLYYLSPSPITYTIYAWFILIVLFGNRDAMVIFLWLLNQLGILKQKVLKKTKRSSTQKISK